MSVGIVGLGYVGLPLAVAFAEAGQDVVGVDVDDRKLRSLEAGESYIEDVASEVLQANAGRLSYSQSFEVLSDCEAVVIAVPTPLTPNREPDLTALVSSGEEIARVLRQGQLVVLESTTYPGTTRDRLAPILAESGLTPGEDFNLAFSPERIDPGRTDFTLRTTPKVVGGLTDACRERAVALYSTVCDTVVPVGTPEVAELTKLLENVFRAVNIALVNELAVICDRMGIDVWEVVEAAATKPYGFMSFKPGPGLGGHCLPVDPFYLSWRAREFDQPTEFIELAGEVNQAMPYFSVEKISRALNEQERSVKGSAITVIGVAYKPGVGDLRESPAIRIMRILEERGAKMSYHDDLVPELPEFGLHSQDLETSLAESDVAVILTAHPGLDVEKVVNSSPLVVDFRGVSRSFDSDHVVRL